ncbi:MAG: NADH-quinone oxidoreductase subunit 5 family protein [Candidatus Xenobia bacterium]
MTFEAPTSWVLFVPLLPLLASLTVLGQDAARPRRRSDVALGAFVLAFVGALAALVLVARHGAWIVRVYQPGTFESWVLPLGMQVDRFGAVMMVLIAGVGTLIFRYATSYMQQEPGYDRFLALIGVTTSTLLAMVASPNLLMLFVCWQFLSYLLALLAHNFGHAPTLRGAMTTFWCLRLGDTAFLLGIALAWSLYGTMELDALFTRAAQAPGMLWIWPGITIAGPTAVTALLLVGAMSKSAQFPLHVWLPRSLYAPTPVTALLHAGIVNAAGFLINRLAPLYGHSPTTLHAAFVIGAVTALFGASTMLVQNDIKKTLGFSTISQMGYMLMECGLGAFALAVFHLIAHGLFKATLFLSCGDVIHKARVHPAMPLPENHLDSTGVSRLTLATGLSTTLLLPVVILLTTHRALSLPLLTSQGEGIFLFFIWVTSSQAILTLARLRTVASWKLAVTMVVTTLAVVSTYLFAAERFSEFLYPDAAVRESFFHAAALAGPLFDGIVVLSALAIALSWIAVYARSHGRQPGLSPWGREVSLRLYVLLLNHLYVEKLWAGLARRFRPGSPPRRARRPASAILWGSLAALGLVPIGVFSGLVGSLLTRFHGLSAAMILAVLTWGILSGILFEYALAVQP